MVFKGFVTKAGYQRLSDIARYLTAMERRLEKLQIDPNQDRLKMLEVEKVQKALDSIVAQQPKGQPLRKELAQGYWMIEELRVSLFAQNLKTPFPISAKRILNYLKEYS
jgi:ATP-dependent helicase HrpA